MTTSARVRQILATHLGVMPEALSDDALFADWNVCRQCKCRPCQCYRGVKLMEGLVG